MTAIRFGYWLPVFGGWLRNAEHEEMEASWPYVRRLGRRAEEIGFDLTLIAELNLNDIKGTHAPALHAWSTAAALAAVTSRQEIMVAVRPNFHEPVPFAKEAANVDRISGGRLSLNVVSSWWKEEARQYGAHFDRHDARYERTGEWLEAVQGLWSRTPFSFRGEHYAFEDVVVEPKPLQRPRPFLYAGGESPAGKALIAARADGYLTHGDPPETIAPKVREMQERRGAAGLPPLRIGVAGFVVCRRTEEEAQRELRRITEVREDSPGYGNFREWLENTELEGELARQEYSVSNRGLRTGLVGTPEQVAEGIARLEEAGVDLLLLQFSPQLEEMERFSEEVIPLVRGRTPVGAAAVG
jgi:dimethylsulfone monooxygenase